MLQPIGDNETKLQEDIVNDECRYSRPEDIGGRVACSAFTVGTTVGLFLLISTVAILPPLALSQGIGTKEGAASRPIVGWELRGEEIVGVVREHFFNKATAEAWAAKHRGYAAKATSADQFALLTRRILGELNASHTGYFTRDDSKYHGLRAIFDRSLSQGPVEWDSPGADFTSENFVRLVFAGGPAAKAGLRRGDKILLADGNAFHPVASFRGKSGQATALTVARVAGARPVSVTLTPRRINAKSEWLEAQRHGATIVVRNGGKIAYVPLFSCAGDEHHEALQELLGGPLKDADALVLDFRDGFGGCNPQFVNLFSNAPAILTQVGRDGKRQTYDPQWRKPLVVLINEGTTSGKEVVAHSLKKLGRATLVGRRTAGAVLGGRCFALSEQSLLYLAVADVLVDGERLEARGVDPDVEVSDKLEFCSGADPQLDKAIDVASAKLTR